MPSHPTPKKVLAIQFKQIGDSVLMVPSLRAIRQQWPACELHVLVFEDIAQIIRPLPWVNHVWGVPKSKSLRSIFSILRMLLDLRRLKFCRSVDFGANDRGAWLGFFIHAKLRLGAKKKRKGALHVSTFGYNQAIAQKYDNYYQAAVLSSVLRAWGVYPKNLKLELYADDQNKGHTSLLLPSEFICLHLTTARVAKNWPVPKWSHLHNLLCEREFPVVVSAGSSREEREILKEFSDASPNAIVLPSFDTILDYLNFIKSCRLLVCGDTAPVHIAAALNVSTLTLFGPTDHLLWKPRGEGHYNINSKCPCKAEKSFGDRKSQCNCMDSIDTVDVFEMVSKILDV